MARDFIMVSERRAAQMLDLPPSEFRRLWKQGHLPPPKLIESFERWPVEELQAIASGAVSKPKRGLVL